MKKGISKYEIIREVLTDKYMLPETKLVLTYMFYVERKSQMTDDEMMDILNLSKYKVNRVIKQLKELNLLEEGVWKIQ